MGTIYDIYNEQINCLKNEFGENTSSPISSIEDLGNEDKCKKLIFNILKVFRKEYLSSSVNIKQLRTDRITHVVSCFFMGRWLYQTFFKDVLDDNYFQRLNMKGENPDKDFDFLWALTCLYHDAGYAYENGNKCMLPDFSLISEEHRSEYVPVIYSLANIKCYEILRRENHAKLDHGIYGALELRKDLNGFLIKDLPPGRTPMKAYECAVWSIMCHNIWFIEPKSACENCYKAKGLHEFILQNAREDVNICDFPLFYLLSLADNLEPSKTLPDYNNWECIEFLPSNHSLTIQKNNKLDESEKIDVYIKSIQDLDNWLISINPRKEETKCETPQEIVLTSI